MKSELDSPKKSLTDILGIDYINSVCEAYSYLSGIPKDSLIEISNEIVDYYPSEMQDRLNSLIVNTGKKVIKGIEETKRGAGTFSFVKATNTGMSPLAGYGFFRMGEDGKIYLITKSEHYHASLGHFFPGYALIDNAKKIGIDNVTHNNTRGYITRLLEEELIAIANGIKEKDREELNKLLNSDRPHILNRVINLETGSLAVEAGIKMMLARFYKLSPNMVLPKYHDRIPVFIVLADYNGGKEANYHGTTMFAQFMRGLWPGILEKMEKANVIKIISVEINDIDSFTEVLSDYDSGEYKIAGLLHELILMNYGGIKLDRGFIQDVYDLCKSHDIPILVDEIQSCIWSPELFMYREYGLNPDFVAVGKGMPGGQYPASRIITTSAMDNLDLFGALVTNGQEELSSLSYLITMDFARANKEHTREVGDYYENRLRELVNRYPEKLEKIEGSRHLSSIFFYTIDDTIRFVEYLNREGIDISAHTYKQNCPPAALTKLPIISTKTLIDFVIDKMNEALMKL